MEKKKLVIKPYYLKGCKEQGITFKAMVLYDDTARRNITIKGNYENFPKQIWDPLKMKSVFLNYMYLSNIPMNSTRQQFMNMSFRNFPDVTITNELIRQEQH